MSAIPTGQNCENVFPPFVYVAYDKQTGRPAAALAKSGPHKGVWAKVWDRPSQVVCDGTRLWDVKRVSLARFKREFASLSAQAHPESGLPRRGLYHVPSESFLDI